jgi:hypothetical protein
MGMDVYGKNAKNETGEYFRRNVWGWHPLWEYCENVHTELVEDVKHGHSNDGDGLDEDGALALANALRSDLENGTVDEYISARNKVLSELERESCDICGGTGIRSDETGERLGMPTQALDEATAILLGRTNGWCNACRGEGKKDHWALNYSVDKQDIEEFADFLANCGGFEIC